MITKPLDLSRFKKTAPAIRAEGDTTSNQINSQPKEPIVSVAKPIAKPLNINLKLPSKEATKEPIPAIQPVIPTIPTQSITISRNITAYDREGNPKDITLNDKQLEFSSLVANGISCVLIGAAGTGKTTCTQAGIAALMQSGNVMVIKDATHKHLKAGSPGIIITSYTRRAVQNIKRQVPLDLGANTITVHKTLEYSPVYYEVIDELTGKFKTKRVFEPKRTVLNKLCSSIGTVIIDEASMLSYELFDELRAALPTNCQYIFIGDLNQLPPVFGHAILGYKLLELPVIELTEVYRQALESPIIKLAHRILSGKPLMDFQFKDYNEPGKLQIIPYPKQLDSEHAMIETCKMFYAGYDSGSYNPSEDVILCPQTNDKSDKKYNCTLINKYIANHIARKEGRVTFEIIVGFRKLYFSVGDSIIYDKQDAVIKDIRKNDSYLGVDFQVESENLDYFGHNSVETAIAMQNSDLDIDKMMELAQQGIDEGAKQQASHIITIQLIDQHSEQIVTMDLKTVGELSAIDLAYAMTVHKSQGSEWRKVFLLLHKSHNVMLSRELLYTAVTRAREQLIVICEKDSFIKGISKQRIKGNTLTEKAEFFKGKTPTSKASDTK